MARREATERWVAGYVRVSTDMQVERESLANQEQALEAHCRAEGARLVLYRDAGISAKDTERPALQRLLADVRAGHVAAVLVTKLDRISRSLHDLLELVATFEAAGVTFTSLRDHIDTGGPVGRFILHILGAIAELERGITAERVAADMVLRARRGKWNGGLAPYGRRVVAGALEIVPEEAVVLHRARRLFLDKRTWLGVAVALNREGVRTRAWEPLVQHGQTVRQGKAAAEWSPNAVKRVLLQRINAGTLVYNRRRVKGRTSVARPAGEHVTVEGFCEPIFSHDEMAEVLQVAAEVAGVPPRLTGSAYLLSGLVQCACGARMYAVRNYVTTRQGRYMVLYYRCKRASHHGTCTMRTMPAALLEPLVVDELRGLGLDPGRLRDLAASAQAHAAGEVQPLLAQRAALAREGERLAGKAGALLELAEDRLITREEFARRKAQLDGERETTAAALATAELELAARAATTIDVEATLGGLQRLGDVYEELADVRERRRLLAACLNRVVVRSDAVELHLPTFPTLVTPVAPDGPDGPDGAPPGARRGGRVGRTGDQDGPAAMTLGGNRRPAGARPRHANHPRQVAGDVRESAVDRAIVPAAAGRLVSPVLSASVGVSRCMDALVGF